MEDLKEILLKMKTIFIVPIKVLIRSVKKNNKARQRKLNIYKIPWIPLKQVRHRHQRKKKIMKIKIRSISKRMKTKKRKKKINHKNRIRKI